MLLTLPLYCLFIILLDVTLAHFSHISQWLLKSVIKGNERLFISVPSVVVLFPLVIDFIDDCCIYETLKSGPKKSAMALKYFSRPKLEENIFKSISHDGFYYLVTGEQGIGKTSLMNHISIAKAGVIYVSCPMTPLSFGQAFADAIGYKPIYDPPLYRQIYSSLSVLPSSKKVTEIMPEFWASQKKFFQAVKKYIKRTGRIPILIIDDVNKFSEDELSMTFLLKLQKLAKKWADDKILTTVFVSSEGQAEYFLLNNSSQSRLKVFEIPDLIGTEISQFLEFSLPKETITENIIELNNAVDTATGGRILYLKRIVQVLEDGESISKACNDILNLATKDFHKAGMLLSTDYRFNAFWVFVEHLINFEPVPDLKARKMLPGTFYQELRKTNVIAFHETVATVTFQSQAHRTMASQLLLKKQQNEIP